MSSRFLIALIEELDAENLTGMLLTGSYARGTHTNTSDVDILRFFQDGHDVGSGHYSLRMFQGKLVSTTDCTVSSKREQFQNPGRCFYAIPGIRQAVILRDRRGALRKLKKDAEAFSWDSIDAKANQFVSEYLAGTAEGVHKILSGFERNEWSAIFAGSLEIQLTLPMIVAVHKRLLFESENAFFAGVLESVGLTSEWAEAFRSSTGVSNTSDFIEYVHARGRGSLRLYVESFKIVEDILEQSFLPVINNAIALIEESINS